MKVVTGVVVDEFTLTIDELAQACACETRWVVEHVESGVLSGVVVSSGEQRFASAALTRARRLIEIERSFDADPELAALTVDLIEEIETLKRALRS
ncbi:MAG TPA: chaperone modulator CbpM [Casimicrobiaceae bacterium]|nr:chaperone modulator CbpM [Casimicrobiaceae bacterium]